MKTGKKIALFLSIATGAAVAMMTIGKTNKNKNLVTRTVSKSGDKRVVESHDDSEVNYI